MPSSRTFWRALRGGCLVAVGLIGSGAFHWGVTRRDAIRSTETARTHALRHGRLALRLAETSEDTRRRTGRLIELAALLVERASLNERRVPLGAGHRIALGRSRVALAAARRLFSDGLYAPAGERAAAARDLARDVYAGVLSLVGRYADPVQIARWQGLIRDTAEWSRRSGRAAIVVSKAAHRVTVYEAGRVVRTYYGDMGFNWVADKRRAGDGATPEGHYRVVAVRTSGSAYYKALLVDYPNAQDRRAYAEAQLLGVLPPGAQIGGQIEIHGEGGVGRDWTDGCVALANADLDDLIRRVEVGTPVTIVGASQAGEMAGRLTGPPFAPMAQGAGQ